MGCSAGYTVSAGSTVTKTVDISALGLSKPPLVILRSAVYCTVELREVTATEIKLSMHVPITTGFASCSLYVFGT